jgi:hypothetical protein
MKATDPTIATSPRWGVGVEFPLELTEQEGLEEFLDRLGNAEFIAEGFFNGRRADFIKKLAAKGTPVVGHSIELSIGSAEPLKRGHLDSIIAVLNEVNTVIYSDHLCMTDVGGVEIGQLTTLPWTWEAVDVVCRKVEEVQKIISWPFLLENITNRFIVPGNDMTEPEFINAITSRTGCGLLLDVTNLYTNSVNFRYDPRVWFAALDKNAVKGIHLAGGIWEDGVLYDSHSRPVYDEVWELFGHVMRHSAPDAVVVEWDQDTPTLATLGEEVTKAESVIQAARPRTSRVITGQEARSLGVTP